MVHENSPHRFGGGDEEMPAAVELLIADQSQIGFVNEGGGIEGVAGRFRCHPRGGEFSHLVVHEWEQVGGGLAIAGLGSIEEAGHIGHAAECNRGVTRSNLKGVVRPSAS